MPGTVVNNPYSKRLRFMVLDQGPARPGAWVSHALVGMAIAAPVFWMFTKALAINLLGLTNTGWL